MKIAVLTVIYPKIRKYLNNYFLSLQKQSYKNFELVVVNENFKKPLKIINKNNFPNLKIIKSKKNPELNRISGLKECLMNKFDLVICHDADDTLHKDNIKKIVLFFQKNKRKNICFSNVIFRNKTFFKKGKVGLKDIINENILGYGSMSIKTEIINSFINSYKYRPKVYDWFFCLSYLCKKNYVNVIKESKINYRNYNGNLLNQSLKLSKRDIISSAKLKLDTYYKMEKFCKYDKKNKFLFNRKIIEMKNLIKYLKNKKNFSNYVSQLKKVIKNNNKHLSWLNNAHPLTNFDISK